MVYEKELVLKEGDLSRPIGERNMQRDMHYTVDAIAGNYRRVFNASIELARQRGDSALASVPDMLQGVLENGRPGNFDEGTACSGFVLKIKRWNIGSARGKCAASFGFLERWIVDWYVDRTARLVEATRLRVASGRQASAQGFETFAATGSEEIDRAQRRARKIVTVAFAILQGLKIWSYLAIVSGLIAGFQMVAGRILFKAGTRGEPSKNFFRLSGGQADHLAQSSLAIVSWPVDEVPLRSMEYTGNAEKWFVKRSATQTGEGAEEDPALPQLDSCVVQRLLNDSYLFNRVDATEKRVFGAPLPGSPRIIGAGANAFVVVKVQSAQELILRLADLVAFTSNIQLRSVYSTHYGAHVLGLGSFYTVVANSNPSVSGAVVLRSAGRKVHSVEDGEQVTPATLLVWHRSTAFTLEQKLTFKNTWLAGPSVRVHDTGAALVDEDRPDLVSVTTRFRRVLRYWLLPF